MFYLKNMLPSLVRRLPVSQLASVSRLASQDPPVVSFPGDIQGVVGPANEVNLQSPTIRKGKRVIRPKTGHVGEVVDVVDGAEGEEPAAYVRWDGKDQKRLRPVAVRLLAVKPAEDIVEPDRKGQQVMIVGGKKTDLYGKVGTIVSIELTRCTVELDEGGSSEPNRVHLAPGNVTALDGQREITVPRRHGEVHVPLPILDAYMQKYQSANVLNVVGDMTVENFVTETGQMAAACTTEAAARTSTKPRKKK